jgi:hypothetical protein
MDRFNELIRKVNMKGHILNKELLDFWIKYFCDCDFAYNIQNSIPNFEDVIAQTNVAVVSGNAMVIPEYAEAYKIYLVIDKA